MEEDCGSESMHKHEPELMLQNAEIDAFRGELDEILGVLRELKRRGVRIPIGVDGLHALHA